MIATEPATVRYPPPGTILLGKYRVDAVLGEGGMGVVVRAIHLELEEPVAIKVLLPAFLERDDIVKRFLREAKAAAKLKSSHVARVIDVGTLDGAFAGRPYIVMEYLEGADLRAIIKHHGPQDSAVAVDLLLQACEAIAEAHSFGIIHRDIKPSNFFITRPDDVTSHLKVVDFGIATAPDDADLVTRTDTIVGTPAYMAPEQMRKAREANPQSDVWSLGVVLYEMLEGRRPWPQEPYPELILAIGMDPPQLMTRTSEALRALVYRCIEKPLDRRFASVAELSSALVPFASDEERGRASAEITARLLERRRPTGFGVVIERGIPISETPPPLTPNSRLPVPAQPYREPEQAPTTPVASPPRRWAVVLASFVVATALGGAAWWWLTERASPAAPAKTPGADVERLVPPDIGDSRDVVGPPDATKPPDANVPSSATKPPVVAPPDATKPPDANVPSGTTKPPVVAPPNRATRPAKTRPTAKPEPDDPFSRR